MSRAPLWHALVGDPRSRRAIEETLLDVRAERASARRAPARIAWTLQAIAALARVSVRVSLIEFNAMTPGAWVVRLLLWTTVPLVLLLTTSPFMRLGVLPGRLPVWLTVALLPQALTVVLPFSVFWTTLWPPRNSKTPALVPAIVALVIVAASVVATPPANQLFRTTVFAANGGQGSLLRTASEMSLVELARVGLLNGELPDAQSTRPRVRQQFFLLSGLIVLATSWAAAGRRLARVEGHRWPWAIALQAITIAGVYLGSAGGLWAAAFVSLPLARWWSAKQQLARLA